MLKKAGKIIKISGPLVVADGMDEAKMYEVVKVSNLKLIGEVIRLDNGKAYIQVYEDTTMLKPGEDVYLTGNLLSAMLGPGLLTSIYDGIQRPLKDIESKVGAFITRGIETDSLNLNKKWHFKAIVKEGDIVNAGDIIGEVKETEIITHRIMTPNYIKEGRVEKIESGDFNVNEVVAKINGENITMTQIWPIRNPRPIKEKMAPYERLLSGQRVIDTFFPIAKGGTGCAPGPFGAGKTVIQQQLAKWSDADIIVYIGCGERGNEMTDVLMEFPELTDPKTGKSLMERTILIANTSNMPVAAREASIYMGITIAEYYRDMGYNVALMADSTSRWAEALREISGRLEEMPGEEGYPAYLGSRTASFYERAGFVKCLGEKDDREGSLTVIGAVSPPGGDLAEPVTQNTLRVTRAFWSLDASLAYKRHFPSVNWLNSYSLYADDLKNEKGFSEQRNSALSLLQQEASLEEIVRLVGVDALSPKEQLILDTTKSIREDFLMQNAFDDIDTYTSIEKQRLMLKLILDFHNLALKKIGEGIKLTDLINLPIKDKISRAKEIKEENLNELEKLFDEIKKEVEAVK